MFLTMTLQGTEVPSVADQIVQVIDSLCQKFGIAFDWTATNVWPYIQELGAKFIAYRAVISVVMILVAIAFAIASKIMFTRAIEFLKIGSYKREMHQTYGMWAMFSIAPATTIAAIALFFVFTVQLVTCLTFPEKIIYDYIKGLLM